MAEACRSEGRWPLAGLSALARRQPRQRAESRARGGGTAQDPAGRKNPVTSARERHPKQQDSGSWQKVTPGEAAARKAQLIPKTVKVNEEGSGELNDPSATFSLSLSLSCF